MKMIRRIPLVVIVSALALIMPQNQWFGLPGSVDQAEAKKGGKHGGYRGGSRAKPRGAKSRSKHVNRKPAKSRHKHTKKNRPSHARPKPSRPKQPAAKPRPPSAGKPNRPSNSRPNRPDRPSAGKPNRPNRPGAGKPNRPNRPGAGKPNRPNRPGAGKPNRPNRPGTKPPNWRPPIAGHPPGYRPPGYRPPGYRPPNWRPPSYRPPYYRPPHWNYGNYYWYPRWGWYHTAIVAGATLVYVASLPNNGSDCVTIRNPDGTLYTCDDVIYRPTYYRDEQVYEVVTPAEQSAPASTTTASNDQDAEELLLTSPFLRGDRVRAVQNALSVIGFDVGSIDGIFGNDTDQAVRAFQEWWEMPVTGVVDTATAQAIGEAYAWTISPENTASAEEVAEGSAEDAQAAPAADGAQDDGEAAAPQSDDGATGTPSDGDGASATQTEDNTETQQDGSSATETDESTTQSD